ncbi:IPTL-CTERM sorting domain-containing protein [Acidovorax sp. GBBC 3334]|uniref:IPTL-CTERM sorting domain-containing protein n=1 Tax=unclassified Acidovorax TaxID=2684926 RepID=UPI002302F72F|nr:MULTISPECIES: IPTL-CTERM sorting domain-containing protein [unclassified Acidovorax]MDA8456271.1 IPTL-CTERM sorting domain-containing protein [Acidovorax sp. GBBC 3334]MDA8519807.1 IPTL-CTERM sorting domain-containing protein [Acidovorax sp. NCPPB 4044]
MVRHSLRWLAGATLALTLCAPAAAQWVVPPGGSLDVPPGGAVDIACTALDMQGTLNLTGGTLSVDSTATFGSGSNVTGSGGTISVGGDVVANGTLNTGNNTLVLRDGCDPGNTSQLSGTIVVQNLVLQSTTGRTFVLPQGANITVLGTLTLQGTAGQPVQLVSASGTAVINLGPAATVVRNFASVPPTVQIGAAAPPLTSIPTLSEYGLMLLSLLMAGTMFWKRRELAAHTRRRG